MIMNKTMKILRYDRTENMLALNRVDQANLKKIIIISVYYHTQIWTISFDRNCYRTIEIPRLFLCCNQWWSVMALCFDKMILSSHDIFELMVVLNGDQAFNYINE